MALIEIYFRWEFNKTFKISIIIDLFLDYINLFYKSDNKEKFEEIFYNG